MWLCGRSQVRGGSASQISYVAGKKNRVDLTVIMSVFAGGDGSTSGGRSERSRESGDLFPDDARERCGEGFAACMFAIKYARKCMIVCELSV